MLYRTRPAPAFVISGFPRYLTRTWSMIKKPAPFGSGRVPAGTGQIAIPMAMRLWKRHQWPDSSTGVKNNLLGGEPPAMRKKTLLEWSWDYGAISQENKMYSVLCFSVETLFTHWTVFSVRFQNMKQSKLLSKKHGAHCLRGSHAISIIFRNQIVACEKTVMNM